MSELLIRPYRAGDANELFAAVVESTRDVYPWLPWCHPAYTLAEAEAWVDTKIAQWKEGTEFQFAVTSTRGAYLGGCGLNALNGDHGFANLGYWMRSSSVRKGAASTAVTLVRDWAFANTKLVRLEVLVATGNVASLRVAEKAGAVFEGTLRNRLRIHDKNHDAAMYSFIPNRE